MIGHGYSRTLIRCLARMTHEHFCCNRRSATLAREASSMRETSFVKRISFRSLALHVSHLLPALHEIRFTLCCASRGTRCLAISRRTVMNNAG